MAIQLCDLSSELLEGVAFYLSSKDCLCFMLTCKYVHEVVSVAPMYHAVQLVKTSATSAFPAQLLLDQLTRNPAAGRWIKHYNLLAAFGPTNDEEICNTSYHIGLALMLLQKMPNLLSLSIPRLPRLATASYVTSLFHNVLEAKSLVEVLLENSTASYNISFDQVRPLFTLPALRSLGFTGFDLEPIPVPLKTDAICKTVIELRLHGGTSNSKSLVNLFATFPNVKLFQADLVNNLSAANIIDAIVKHYPALYSLDLAQHDSKTDKVRDDWLRELPNLRTLYITDTALTWKSLDWLPASVTYVDIVQQILLPTSVALAIDRWAKGPELPHRRTVTVNDQGKDNILQKLIIRECAGSLIDLQFRP